MNHDGITAAELEPYDHKIDQLASEIHELLTKREECRGERELLEDFRRYDERISKLTEEKAAIATRRAAYVKSHRIFDRELNQYELADQWFADEISKRQALVDAGQLARSDGELQRLRQQRDDLDQRRQLYFRDRDFLAANGPTEGIVMPGSIVTVKDAYGDRYKFVLTARPFDTEYPVESYSSHLGSAVIKKVVGDRVLERLNLFTEIVEIEPGFRLSRPRSAPEAFD